MLAAIHAGVLIAQQDILARKRAALEWYVDVFGQSDHGRGMDRQAGRVQHMAVMFFHTRDALEDHDHGAPFGANIYRLKRSI